jgi:hypothetical protein
MSARSHKPKYPPQRTCGLACGTECVVTEAFDATGVGFEEGERIVFRGEMLDVYDSYDAWTFTSGEREKVIRGYGAFAEPKEWLAKLRPMLG